MAGHFGAAGRGRHTAERLGGSEAERCAQEMTYDFDPPDHPRQPPWRTLRQNEQRKPYLNRMEEHDRRLTGGWRLFVTMIARNIRDNNAWGRIAACWSAVHRWLVYTWRLGRSPIVPWSE